MACGRFTFVSSSETHTASLLHELPTFFTSFPSPNAILEFRPSMATVERANHLLEELGQSPLP